jgi:hypothetical protein
VTGILSAPKDSENFLKASQIPITPGTQGYSFSKQQRQGKQSLRYLLRAKIIEECELVFVEWNSWLTAMWKLAQYWLSIGFSEIKISMTSELKMTGK